MFFYVTGRMLPLLAVSACAADARCGETHAFVDLGANDGQSLQWFRRNWAAPAAAAAQPYNFVAAFEMNSHFSPVLRTELARWPDSALMIGAAWTTDGDMDASMQQPNSRTGYKNGMFYNMTASALMVGGMPLNRHAGSTRLQRTHQRARAAASASAHTQTQTVRTFDLARWLSARFCRKDVVDVKMDIEGAEFEVLEHLLQHDAAGLIDTLAVEWHTNKRGRARELARLLARQQRIQKGLQRAGVQFRAWRS